VTLRIQRTVDLLSRLAVRGARTALERFAAGPPTAAVTRAAQQLLNRLAAWGDTGGGDGPLSAPSSPSL
jgi:hypothetical protein